MTIEALQQQLDAAMGFNDTADQEWVQELQQMSAEQIQTMRSYEVLREVLRVFWNALRVLGWSCDMADRLRYCRSRNRMLRPRAFAGVRAAAFDLQTTRPPLGSRGADLSGAAAAEVRAGDRRAQGAGRGAAQRRCSSARAVASLPGYSVNSQFCFAFVLMLTGKAEQSHNRVRDFLFEF